MTKEEEKAIERLTNGKKIDFNTLIRKFKKEGIENFVITKKEYIETVLNKLKEKDKEINKYKKKNTELSNQLLILYKEQDNYNARIEKKNAEIEKYKYLYQKALDNTIQADKENIQLKKQIDLMAETIRKLAISLANYKGSYNKETINFTGNIKYIKQYFERKARDGRD